MKIFFISFYLLLISCSLEELIIPNEKKTNAQENTNNTNLQDTTIENDLQSNLTDETPQTSLGLEKNNDGPFISTQSIENTSINDNQFAECLLDHARSNNWQVISDITNLNCANKKIHSITELLQFKNLEAINFSNNFIDRISLEGLSKLTLADFSKNYIKEKPQSTSTQETTLILNENLLSEKTENLFNVAVIFVKDSSVNARFSKEDLYSRIVNQANGLLRWHSFNKAGFGLIDTFGWFELTTEQFNALVTSNNFSEIPQVVEAKRNGTLNLDNYDYIIGVWDDTEMKVAPNGTAPPHPVDIIIDGTTYTSKLKTGIYLKDFSLRDNCFYSQQNYNDLAACFDNPFGPHLKSFELVIFHEFLHTQKITTHSVLHSCTDFISGQCDNKFYNMHNSLASARFHGTGVDAYTKHRIGWLIDSDIVTLTNVGEHTITLYDLNNPNTVKKAVKINYDDFAGFDIWLEYRQPSLYDYGYFNPVFDPIINGLMIYKDAQLLDPTPETNSQFSQIDTSITEQFISPTLGLKIEIQSQNKSEKSITFKLTLTPPEPTRNPPIVIYDDCTNPSGCEIQQGGSYTTKAYWAALNDLGYGDQRTIPWQYEFINLPSGITYSDDGIKRQYTDNPSSWSGAPHTFITFQANNNIAIGQYEFIMRFKHPEDESIYIDKIQYLNVIEP